MPIILLVTHLLFGLSGYGIAKKNKVILWITGIIFAVCLLAVGFVALMAFIGVGGAQ